MRVSVIIPIYNVEQFLAACLDSVLAQSLHDIEVICVDDGSTDGSLALAQAYAARDKRVRVIACEHSNAGRCRNVGMAEAKGEWLSFLDADDVFAPTMLEELVAAGETNAADVVTCKFRRFDDGADYHGLLNGRGAEFKIVSDPANHVDVFDRWVGWAWDKLFRREFLERNGLKFQEVTSSNDLRFVYSALALAERVAEADMSFIAHRMHPQSLQATRRKIPTNFLSVLRSFQSEMQSRGVFVRSSVLWDSFLRFVISFSIFQLDYIGSLAAHAEVRQGVVAYWRELNIARQLRRLCGWTTRCRCLVVLHLPCVEWLYYRCVKSILCNSNVRSIVKRSLCKR